MTAVQVRDRDGRRILSVSPGGVARWLTVVGSGTVVAWVVLAVDRGGPWWPAVVLVLLAVASAGFPDCQVPLATVGFAAGWWVVAVPSPSAGTATLVALALLVLHAATTHAAVGPPGREVRHGVLPGVLGRAAGAGLGTVAVGLGAATTAGRVGVPAGVLVLALVAVGALAVTTTGATTRPTTRQ